MHQTLGAIPGQSFCVGKLGASRTVQIASMTLLLLDRGVGADDHAYRRSFFDDGRGFDTFAIASFGADVRDVRERTPFATRS